jgi:hypothetical protein
LKDKQKMYTKCGPCGRVCLLNDDEIKKYSIYLDNLQNVN